MAKYEKAYNSRKHPKKKQDYISCATRYDGIYFGSREENNDRSEDSSKIKQLNDYDWKQ